MPVKSPNIVDVTVGQNVRLLRIQRGVSQEKLGDALGITFQQIQKYERGANRISSSRLSAIANYFKVDVATLFAGTSHDETATAIVPFSSAAVSVARAFDGIHSPKVRIAIRSLIQALSEFEAASQAISSS